MYFEKFDSEELARAGIKFEDAEDRKRFEELIMEELEVRIGEKISANMPEEQLLEFDRITDPTEAKNWLKKHCPRYGDVVRIEKKRLGAELIRFKSRIMGVRSQ